MHYASIKLLWSLRHYSFVTDTECVEVIPRFEEQSINGLGKTNEIHVVKINSLLSSAEVVRTAQPSSKVNLGKLLGYELHWDYYSTKSSVSNICLVTHIL